MLPQRHWLPRLTFALVIAFDAVAPTHSLAEPENHRPTATDRFISHRFTLEAHTPERVQLAIHSKARGRTYSLGLSLAFALGTSKLPQR